MLDNLIGDLSFAIRTLRDRGADPRAGHWREHGDFQRDKRRNAADRPALIPRDNRKSNTRSYLFSKTLREGGSAVFEEMAGVSTFRA